MSKQMRILVVDVGGSSVKCLATGHGRPRKFKSGPRLNPDKMVSGVLKISRGWRFDAVSIGYPGVVRRGKIVREPHNLGLDIGNRVEPIGLFLHERVG